MRGSLVVHAAVGKSRHSEVLSGDRLRIGRGEGCDLRLPYGSTPASLSLNDFLELARSNGHYEVTDFNRSLDIRHNGAPIRAGDIIEDGDEVCAPAAQVALSFFPVNSLALTATEPRRAVHLAPVIEQGALKAGTTERRQDARMFLREFTRELIRETSPATKTLVLLLVLALLGGIAYLGFSVYSTRRQDRALIGAQGDKLEEHERQLDEHGQRLDEVERQATTAAGQTHGTDEAAKNSAVGPELAPKLWDLYHEGVCLISGTYIFVEPETDRPLRYRETLLNEEGEPLINRDDLEYLTAEGEGPVAEFGYVGTGFHVGQGFIVTNRHVAVGPWESDARVQLLRGMTGGQPRLKRLLAFFPGRRRPLVLKFERAAEGDDLAVCRLKDGGANKKLPALPLADDADTLTVGERVVTMGYPAGPERILALLPENESIGIQKGYGKSEESLIGELAARDMIRPLMTQGNVTDLYRDRIVNDATTGEGGSGAPVFGQNGRVVGVTFAIFLENNASNFAVPAGQAVKLLRQSGWTKEN